MSEHSHLVLETLQKGYRFRARTRDGLDTVIDTGADKVAANPVQLLLHAIGACTAMDVIGILRKKRQDVTGYEVLLEGDRRTEHPKSYTAIRIMHRVRGRGLSLAALEDAVHLSETKYCTVHNSLDPRIVITTRCEVLEEGAEAKA
jgi:putative redox protein